MPQMFEVKEVRNSKGESMLLNEREFALTQALQEKYDKEIRNSLGFELNITTLTAISKRVVEQKFFTIGGQKFSEGDWISIDGTLGEVLDG